MIAAEILYNVNELLIIGVLMIVYIGSAEIGFRAGRKVRSHIDSSSRSAIDGIQTAALGLLALLLAFTFSMAISRFETRRQLVVEDSNAIGTTFLRSRLLPEPHKGETAALLRRYVDSRLRLYEASIDRIKFEAAKSESEALHAQLWRHAVAAGEKDTHALTTSLFIQSLNEMIDLHETRIAALENHVPESVLLLLFVMGLAAMAMVGYGCGLGNRRNLFSISILSIFIAFVILVILDLDRPRRGAIRVGQKSMTDLRDSLNRAQ